MTTQSNGNSVFIQGRLVWGIGQTLFEGKQQVDYNTKQPKIDPKTGQPRVEYGFGLAIPKVDPATGQNTEEYTKVWNALHAEAFTLYPSGIIPSDFAMKFKDGDSLNSKTGQPYASKEGYAGHIVLACTTMIPIKYFVHEGGQNQLVNTGIKVGDYVNVQLTIKAHPAINNGNPGLYLNPNAVQLIQPGKAIINAPSGDQLFGQNAPAYNGQVVADVAPTLPGQPAAPVQPAMPAQPMTAPTAPVAPPVAPNYDVLPQTMQPPAAPQQMGNGVPPAAAPQMQHTIPTAIPTPQANGYVPPVAPSENLIPTAPPMPGMP